MSFLRISYRAQLSAATSSLVSFYRNDLLKLARNNPIVILETLVQLPFVCMDGLTLFFMGMLNLARQGGKSTSFAVYRYILSRITRPPTIRRLDITQPQERAETR